MAKDKFYCIRFEEGCSTFPCYQVCSECEGYLTREQMNDKKQKSNQEHQDGQHKEG